MPDINSIVQLRNEREPAREAYDRFSATLPHNPAPLTLGLIREHLDKLSEAGVPDDAFVSGFGSGYTYANWQRAVWQSPRERERLRNG